MGKHICWSLFLIKLHSFRPAILLRLQHRCYPVKYVKFLKAPILKNICERLNMLNYTKPCSHPIPRTPPNHSHPLPFTPTHCHSTPLTPNHLQPTSIYFHSFLAISRLFLAYSHPLPLIFSPLLLILSPLPPMCSLSHPLPVHIQTFLPIPTQHLPFKPIRACVFYVPVFLFAYVLMCPCAYVIHFYGPYCLCLYTLGDFVCVNTSGLFIYPSFFKNILVIPVLFF